MYKVYKVSRYFAVQILNMKISGNYSSSYLIFKIYLEYYIYHEITFFPQTPPAQPSSVTRTTTVAPQRSTSTTTR